MKKVIYFLKIIAIIVYGYFSALITPYEIRCALGIRKGIQNDIEGEMFILPSIFLLIIFATIDFAIVMHIIKSHEKTKTQKIISILLFAFSIIVAFIVINLLNDIVYLITK